MKPELSIAFSVVLLLSGCGTNSSTHAESYQPRLGDGLASPNLGASTGHQVAPAQAAQRVQVIKVGQYQRDQADPQVPSEPYVIAKVTGHFMGHDRQAATLYVRNLPVLTFLAPDSSTNNRVEQSRNPNLAVSNSGDQANLPILMGTRNTQENLANQEYVNTTDPMRRAFTIASQLNQLAWNNSELDITVRWDQDTASHVIDINGVDLVSINSDTILPDTTKNPSQDALQATNRLRRLLSDAPPLEEIIGEPKPEPVKVAYRNLTQFAQGMASWYGAGFDGQPSASGERYNQYDLTAAHPSLPFGTKVRVTNMDNGRSVIVRINDRGPFVRGRIIDVSFAAAQLLGIVSSGVAPVSIDVVSPN
jgi:rare lipoprotein A